MQNKDTVISHNINFVKTATVAVDKGSIGHDMIDIGQTKSYYILV